MLVRPSTSPHPSAGRLRLLRDALVYAILKPCLVCVSFLPPALVYRLARACGSAAYLVSRRRRNIALRNLDIAFRAGLSPPEKKRIARRSFQHAVASVVSMALRKRWVHEGNLERLFAISREEDDLLREPHPRGLAVLSSHVGDWEMAHHYLALRGIPVAVVTRRISNRFLDREITRLRSLRGARTLPKRGALVGIRSTLRRGEAAGVLADQNCPARERFFDFFGVPASTYTEYARVLVRSGARVLFIACPCEGFRFRFRVIVRDLGAGLPGFAGAPRREAARLRADELVRRYIETTEELVRQQPDQYLWMHRRWKSRPTGTPWLYHDLGEPLDPRTLETDGVEGDARNAARNAVEP